MSLHMMAGRPLVLQPFTSLQTMRAAAPQSRHRLTCVEAELKCSINKHGAAPECDCGRASIFSALPHSRAAPQGAAPDWLQPRQRRQHAQLARAEHMDVAMPYERTDPNSDWARRRRRRAALAPKSPPPPAHGGPLDDQILGWRVFDVSSKEDIGFVREVMAPEGSGVGSPTLRVASDGPEILREQQAAGLGMQMHLIPYAQPIVQRLDRGAQVLYIAAPEGLLDLGRRNMLLAYLRPILQGVAEAQARREQRLAAYMPSKKQLKAGGHADLVPLIDAAGGFLEVAQALELRARRRPTGFWENQDALDEELGRFVAASWTEHSMDSDPAETYFYNQVTGAVLWDAPDAPTSIALDDSGSRIRVEPEDTRVMPSRSTVMAAGRYDLHHAIVYNGGYRAVAEELGRRPAWPGSRQQRLSCDPAALGAELRTCATDSGMRRGLLPSARTLIEAGRSDLLQILQNHVSNRWQAIRQLGGHMRTARLVKMQTQRRPRGHWQDFGMVVEELRRYMQSRSDAAARGRLPTHRELADSGRQDLRYALQQHGHKPLAAALGVQPTPRGGHLRADAGAD